jgi:5'-3' exonuclease
MGNRIACIDSDTLIWQSCADKIKYDESGKPILDDFGNKIKIQMTLEESKDIFDDLITGILNKTEASHYVLALTTGRNHRYDIFPEYKANRKDKEKPQHFHALKDYCVIKYKAIFHHELEADDICLIYSKELSKEGNYTFMCSIDKDLLGLEGIHYNYDKNMWISTTKEEAEYNLFFDAIVGQSGDGIKGIEGLGKVAATKLLDNKSPLKYPQIVFGAYVKKYGSELGIKEFNKNYQLLKIKDSWPNFKVSKPIKYEKFNHLDINLINY